jgi:hypothetical protein
MAADSLFETEALTRQTTEGDRSARQQLIALHRERLRRTVLNPGDRPANGSVVRVRGPLPTLPAYRVDEPLLRGR